MPPGMNSDDQIRSVNRDHDPNEQSIYLSKVTRPPLRIAVHRLSERHDSLDFKLGKSVSPRLILCMPGEPHASPREMR